MNRFWVFPLLVLAGCCRSSEEVAFERLLNSGTPFYFGELRDENVPRLIKDTPFDQMIISYEIREQRPSSDSRVWHGQTVRTFIIEDKDLIRSGMQYLNVSMWTFMSLSTSPRTILRTVDGKMWFLCPGYLDTFFFGRSYGPDIVIKTKDDKFWCWLVEQCLKHEQANGYPNARLEDITLTSDRVNPIYGNSRMKCVR